MTHRGAPIGRLVFAVAALAVAPIVSAADPPEFSSKQIEFFETKVRPILANRCQKCHAAEKQKGGLRLDGRAALLTGGDSGPAVVPGKLAESPLIEAINYRDLEMPPTGKLADREIAALTEWVAMGAPWPKEQPTAGASRRGDFAITDEDRRYWAFQPVGNPQPPKVRRTEWVANPIDAFVLAKLENKGLEPNPPADRRTLIRRVFFDLIGLPPTPEEIAAFAADDSPAAYERLVDGLLARKEYGERWGRHWLDVVRFGQTNGYERDAEKPEAWRYRDYVIRALNDDKPYDRFILEQLAGDELDEPTRDSITATGFYRLGVWDDEPDDKNLAAWDNLDEIVRTTGSAFLGLTIGCARCHNHMFDPIPQEDYYQLAAFFRNVEPYGTPVSETHLKANADGILTPLPSPTEFAAWQSTRANVAKTIAEFKAKIEALRKPAQDRLLAQRGGGSGATNEDVDKALTPAERAGQEKLGKELARLEESLRKPPFPQALSVRECGTPLKETHVLIRGNATSPGKKVEPRVLTILGGRKLQAIPASTGGESKRSGQALRPMLADLGVKPTLGLRRALAEWIGNEQNPLAPRVMVNRLWQHYFGRGIVRSTDNFGRAEAFPTHPDLLAWLARDFIDGGWRLKRMHNRIVTSSAYKMSSAASNTTAHAADADNDLFWRQNLRRLDAEAIRDSVLAVSGRLNPAMGGRGVFPKLAPEVLATQSKPGFGWDKSSADEESRRSVYVYVKRTLMVPFFESFDYTNTADSLGTRPVTTVAPQALVLLNSDFTFEQAGALAERVRREAGPLAPKQVDRLFRLALGRAPSEKEQAIAIRLLARPRDRVETAPSAGPDALRSLCLVVFNLNEFVYID